MRNFHFVVFSPNLFDCFVRFVLHCRVVQPAFAVFVHNPLLEPGHIRVFEAFVLSDVRLLDHSNLGVQLSAEVIFVPLRNVHIVVHRLLFGGGDGGSDKLGVKIGVLGNHMRLQVVGRIAVFGYGGAPGHNLGHSAYQNISFDPLIHL